MAALLTLLTPWPALAQRPKPPAGAWQLVWADEFNNSGRPDPQNWTYETGFVRNQEAQWYQPENARCEAGLLIIEARREPKPNPNYAAQSPDWQKNRPQAEYTSASLTTRGQHHWQYGRWEMRAKIDTRAGLWPAFWTLGVTGEWPHNGEIDIMEYYRDSLLANAAWGAAERYQANWNTTKKALTAFADPAWAKQFHVWRMDWDERYIRIYVDGLLLNSVDLTKTMNQDAAGQNPFHQPHYMLLNVAVGGTNGGNASATAFPARMEVDYVRVYQKAAKP